MAQYTWSEGCRFKASLADPFGLLVESLAAEHGTVTRQMVVAAARDPLQPTHEMFEWDDAVAGEKWREEQAGEALGKLRYAAQEVESDETPQRVFFASKPGDGYVRTKEMLASPDNRARMREQVLRELETIEKRCRMWLNLVDLADDLAAVRVKHAGGRSTPDAPMPLAATGQE